MNRCPGIKRDGSRCTVSVEPPQTYCWWHDPANSDARRRAASRGGKRAGRGRPQAELVAVKTQLQEMADGVLSGETNRAAAAVAGQLLNIKLQAIEVERKVKETEELEERIEQLERAREGGNRWGA
jgi:predicted RNA-binding Zn ribbon-like protein